MRRRTARATVSAMDDAVDKLSHLDAHGAAHMVDVGGKEESRRRAVAEGWIELRPRTLELLLEGGHRKGDVLGVARVAGIMAAKRTSELIPLCHQLPLSHASLEFETERAAGSATARVRCQARVETWARTGVEMEALAAVQTALLTIYDMCKAVDRGMTMNGIRLLEKAGGRSGRWRRGADGGGA